MNKDELLNKIKELEDKKCEIKKDLLQIDSNIIKLRSLYYKIIEEEEKEKKKKNDIDTSFLNEKWFE